MVRRGFPLADETLRGFMSAKVNNTAQPSPQMCRTFCRQMQDFLHHAGACGWTRGERACRACGQSLLAAHERRVADQRSVPGGAHLAESRPDIPGVAPGAEPVFISAKVPSAAELQSRAHRPDAEQLATPEQLHVVVAGSPHRRPPQ